MKLWFWAILFVCILIVFGGAILFMLNTNVSIHDFVSNRIKIYCEKKFNVKLYIEQTRGDIFKNLFFESVRIEEIKGLPKEFRIRVKSMRFRYSLRQLIERKPRLEIEGLEFFYGSIRMPVKFSQQGEQVTLGIESLYLFLEQLEKFEVLPQSLSLRGLCELRGKVTLEGFKPKFVDISVAIDALEAVYGNIEKIKARVALNLKGEYSAPHLTGAVNIDLAEYSGAWEMKKISFPSWMDAWLIDVSLKGNNLKIQDKTIDAAMKADLKVKKQPSGQPYLAGKVEVFKGNYTAYENKFKISRGEIIFPESRDSQARLIFEGQTKIKGYRIFASMKGTLDDSQIELTSDPTLPKDQIISLLLFGKKLEDLSSKDRKTFLDSGRAMETLLDKLFLGKAEAKIAQLIHADDVSVQASPGSAGAQNQMPSVKVGKYLNGEKFYGTYQVKPSSIKGEELNQTITGEYRVNESIAIEGERSLDWSMKSPQEDKLQVKFHWNF